jgi:hypothetical protein
VIVVVAVGTAMSLKASVPTTLAEYVLLPSTNVTSTVLAPPTTWLLVIIRPSVSYTQTLSPTWLTVTQEDFVLCSLDLAKMWMILNDAESRIGSA